MNSKNIPLIISLLFSVATLLVRNPDLKVLLVVVAGIFFVTAVVLTLAPKFNGSEG